MNHPALCPETPTAVGAVPPLLAILLHRSKVSFCTGFQSEDVTKTHENIQLHRCLHKIRSFPGPQLCKTRGKTCLKPR